MNFQSQLKEKNIREIASGKGNDTASNLDQPPVLLTTADRPVFVLGKPKWITLPAFHVIRALLNAGREGLSKDQLAEQSGHEYAYRILKRLRDGDPDWAAVIQMAGKSWRRYRILSQAPTHDHQQVR